MCPGPGGVEDLRSELAHARYSIIRLMPDDVHEILTSYCSCKSRQETYGWRESVAARIISRAEIPPREAGSFLEDRAVCPLCKGGSTASYEVGFSVPMGLRRHLLGEGNLQQCIVMEAACNLARDCWHNKFHEREEAEEAAKRTLFKERKKTELQYRTVPNGAPELIDEFLGYGRAPRDKDQLQWAEDRLQQLGFEFRSESNVKTYTREHGGVIVYADPRAVGEIVFSVYRRQPPPRTRPGGRRRARALTTFSLKDGWKHELRAKYERRLVGVDQLHEPTSPLRKAARLTR